MAPWLCAALLAGGMANPASADTHAELRLSNFGYSLVDLAPEDGIAPGVTIFTERFATNTGAGTTQRQFGPDGGPVPGGGTSAPSSRPRCASRTATTRN